jgi:hypothetical protein
MRLSILRVMLCKRFARVPVALSDQSKSIRKIMAARPKKGTDVISLLATRLASDRGRCGAGAAVGTGMLGGGGGITIGGSGSITWYGMFPQLRLSRIRRRICSRESLPSIMGSRAPPSEKTKPRTLRSSILERRTLPAHPEKSKGKSNPAPVYVSRPVKSRAPPKPGPTPGTESLLSTPAFCYFDYLETGGRFLTVSLRGHAGNENQESKTLFAGGICGFD